MHYNKKIEYFYECLISFLVIYPYPQFSLLWSFFFLLSKTFECQWVQRKCSYCEQIKFCKLGFPCAVKRVSYDSRKNENQSMEMSPLRKWCRDESCRASFLCRSSCSCLTFVSFPGQSIKLEFPFLKVDHWNQDFFYSQSKGIKLSPFTIFSFPMQKLTIRNFFDLH